MSSIPLLRIVSSGRGKEAKSRSFSAWMLGYLTAEGLWETQPQHSGVCPAWLSYFGSEQEVRAVTANLRAGKPAEAGSTKLELPRSAGYRWQVEAAAGGAVVTAWLPWLFALDAASTADEGACFIFAPPRWWLNIRAAELVPTFGAEAREAARAALFAAYLDRRTEVPVLPDLRFRRRLYRAALEQEWVWRSTPGTYRSSQFRCLDLTQQGLEEPLAVKVSQPVLEAFLIAQSTTYLHEEKPHGTTRIASDGRLLPNPEPVAVQHCLDFGLAAAGG